MNCTKPEALYDGGLGTKCPTSVHLYLTFNQHFAKGMIVPAFVHWLAGWPGERVGVCVCVCVCASDCIFLPMCVCDRLSCRPTSAFVVGVKMGLSSFWKRISLAVAHLVPRQRSAIQTQWGGAGSHLLTSANHPRFSLPVDCASGPRMNCLMVCTCLYSQSQSQSIIPFEVCLF